MGPEAFARELARRIRDEVVPMLGRPEARERVGTAHGGDPTFAIDERAERVAAAAFEEHDDIAYFTEDAGFRTIGHPQHLFLLDPIDGTRPAMAGFESCCVSVAVAPFGTGLTTGDLTYGCVVELPTGHLFEATRGDGARTKGRELSPAATKDTRGLIWAGGFRGQPSVPTAEVLRDLFEAPGAEGAYFDHGSAAYSLTRLATGQLDAYADPGQAIVEGVPGMEEEFRRVGGGHVLNTTTYDTAAGWLVLQELGITVTDAIGGPIDEVPLFTADGSATLVSTVAACTPELHAELLRLIGEGLDRLRAAGSQPAPR